MYKIYLMHASMVEIKVGLLLLESILFKVLINWEIAIILVITTTLIKVQELSMGLALGLRATIQFQLTPMGRF